MVLIFKCKHETNICKVEVHIYHMKWNVFLPMALVYWVVLPLCRACLTDKRPILKRNHDKTWIWCCVIVSSHICWINCEPDKVSFLENNNKCFTYFIQKKEKEITYLSIPKSVGRIWVNWNIFNGGLISCGKRFQSLTVFGRKLNFSISVLTGSLR